MGADLAKVLLTEEQILARLDELAAAIDADYAGRDPLLVGVLKGAVMVMADLTRRAAAPRRDRLDGGLVLRLGDEVLGGGAHPQGPRPRHHRPDVLIVEDIVDSGLTLSWIMANLASRGPGVGRGVHAAAQAGRCQGRGGRCKYVGFDIPNEFVVGYGLDYAERYRNLRVVGTLAPHVYGA